MKSVTIYHNPRCSKSRQALALLRDAGEKPVIVEYLRQPPSADEILELARLLRTDVPALLRRGEAEFRNATDLPNPGDEPALAAWLAAHPSVLQRPIVINADRTRAVVGRPPEKSLELLVR